MLLFTVILYLFNHWNLYNYKETEVEKSPIFQIKYQNATKSAHSWNLPISNLDVFADFYEF